MKLHQNPHEQSTGTQLELRNYHNSIIVVVRTTIITVTHNHLLFNPRSKHPYQSNNSPLINDTSHKEVGSPIIISKSNKVQRIYLLDKSSVINLNQDNPSNPSLLPIPTAISNDADTYPRSIRTPSSAISLRNILTISFAAKSKDIPSIPYVV